jgi:hypothetical protein
MILNVAHDRLGHSLMLCVPTDPRKPQEMVFTPTLDQVAPFMELSGHPSVKRAR